MSFPPPNLVCPSLPPMHQLPPMGPLPPGLSGRLPLGMPPPPFPCFPPPGLPPPGTPMMPMPMAIMPPGPSVFLPLHNPVMIAKPPISQALIQAPISVPSVHPNELTNQATTVFIGNISEKASEALIGLLLAKCGTVLGWKRVQGPSGKLQAFGFCEYREPESSLCALRLLHGLELGGRNLLVKVDAKTKALLDEWKAQHRPRSKTAPSEEEKEVKDEGKTLEDDTKEEALKVTEKDVHDEKQVRTETESKGEGENEDDKEKEEKEDADQLDEETRKKDEALQVELQVLISEHAAELSGDSADSTAARRRRRDRKDGDLEAMGLEDEKKDLITREISKFRDTHKKLEEEKELREKERQVERETKDRDRDRISVEEHHKERECPQRATSREFSPASDRSHERKVSSRERDESGEDPYERKRLAKRLREKEVSYQERLKVWEARERKKAKSYEKEDKKERHRRKEMVKEAKRLRVFFEEYDDARDDPKYFLGTALQKRLWERERESETDERDRWRERDELEELRLRLVEQGHPDPNKELLRMQQVSPCEEIKASTCDSELSAWDPAHASPSMENGEMDAGAPQPNSHSPPAHSWGSRLINSAPSVSSSADGGSSPVALQNNSPHRLTVTITNSPERQSFVPEPPLAGQDLSITLRVSNGSPHQQPVLHWPPEVEVEHASEYPVVSSPEEHNVDHVTPTKDEEVSPGEMQVDGHVCAEMDEEDDYEVEIDEDEDDEDGEKSEERPSNMEKRQRVKTLIEQIPTGKAELFSYKIDWTALNKKLMEKRIKPWVNKKIVEYIGEEEPTLVDFVCSKVMVRSSAQSILDDVTMILDEEAEGFVLKMWRLLIYETEVRKLGLK
uniref:RNA-binding protein 25-like isoform X2 n=1 Tax=Myxine glutinosa TaxID=7769 RepID=UPI00358E87D1